MSRNQSIVISRLLDDLGYSKEMVNFRQRCYESMQCETLLLCGSKREGLSLPFESDYDYMSTCTKRFMECRDVVDGNSRNAKLIIFQLERYHCTAPGYTLLKCISLMNMPEQVRACLVEVDKDTYFLSSDSWKQSCKEHNINFCSSHGNDGFITPSWNNQGPSNPHENFAGVSADYVHTILCHCPQLLTIWRNRQRLHGWPSVELIEMVSSLEAHVVPIGYKDSPLHFLEWRICFTQAEYRLIENLNDCQTKLILLLKMLAKHVLKPVCKEMSSYVMKNLILWMAEKYPSKIFVEDRLLVLLKHSLKELKCCIQNKMLPSYMIEERNLFADRITDIERIELCKKLEMLSSEGGNMLLRCPKILNGLNLFRLSPDQFYLLSERRRCLEKLFLQLKYYMHLSTVQQLNNVKNFTLQGGMISVLPQVFEDVSFQQLSSRLLEILMPDILDALSRGQDICNVGLERFKFYLS